MSFNIDYILNGNLSTIIDYLHDDYDVNNINNNITEEFGIGAWNSGNKTKTINDTQLKNLNDVTKNIDQSVVVNSVAKLINSSINDVVSQNQSSLLQALIASNNLVLSGANVAGNLNLTNITQQNAVDASANASFAQTVQNDITTKISTTFTTKVKNAATNAAQKGTSSSIGDTLGKAMDTISDLGNNFINTAGKVLDGSLGVTSGNNTTTENRKSVENTLKDTFNLNDSFKLATNNAFNNAVSNQLSTNNLANCSQKPSADNNINLSNLTIGGNLTISNVAQQNIVNATLQCVFNQNIVNTLATIYVTDYSNLVDTMAQNTSTENTGDILAAGTAGAAMLAAGGAAIGTAAQGIGSGISTGATGIGSGISSVLSGLSGNALGLIGYLCYCICIVIFIIIAYLYMSGTIGGGGDGGDGDEQFGDDDNN